MSVFMKTLIDTFDSGLELLLTCNPSVKLEIHFINLKHRRATVQCIILLDFISIQENLFQILNNHFYSFNILQIQLSHLLQIKII